MEISTTLGRSRNVSEVYRPTSINQLLTEFKGLHQKHKSISVFSRGRNWGYGCHAPNEDNDLLIDLSACNRIVDFDEYHGVITIEPGVSYGQLAEYLKSKGDKWIAPVHGGGPDGSVVGNALERGYGITPFADHFGSIISLRALLESGQVYERPFKRMGLDRLDKLFKYGIGPYFDGLFSQSGIGIVTEMTIRLSPKPDYVEMFYYNLKNETDLVAAVEAIKKCKRDLGSCVGGINLINRERALSMIVDYPADKVKSGEPLSETEMVTFAKSAGITSWLVVGMLYGHKGLVKAAKKQIKENFRNIPKRSIYFNSTNIRFFEGVGTVLRKLGVQGLANGIQAVSQAFDVLLGTPNNVALRLAYWKHENKELVKQANLNPNRDECGLIWYSPLVEMEGSNVASYVSFLTESAKKFKVNALITLTTVDDLCFDSTVPILFNRKNPTDSQNAMAFYEYILEEGRKRGFYPYRLSIETQKKLNIQGTYFQIPTINPNRYK